MASGNQADINVVCSEPKKQCLSRTTRYRLRKERGKESKCTPSDFDHSSHQEAAEYDRNTLQCSNDYHTGSVVSPSLDDGTTATYHDWIEMPNSQSCLESCAFTPANNDLDCTDYREPDYHYHMYYSDDAESDNNDIDTNIDDTDNGIDTMNQDTNTVNMSEPVVSHPKLFEGSPLDTLSSNVLIMKYSMKHKLTNDALADLLKLLKLHLPTPNHCSESVYCLRKSLDQLATGYLHVTHYFCSSCSTEVEENCVLCPNPDCETALVSIDSRSSFIEIPIEQQLKKIIDSELIS